MTLYVSNVTGDAKNTLYPNKVIVNSKDDLLEAVKKDHVSAEYVGNRRSIKNFISSDTIVMDCDNDDSDDPEDWITPEALAEEFEDVPYAVTFSRHHMIPKDGKAARPKFHVYFMIAPIDNADRYKEMKEQIQEEYPFFDKNALDAGRFIYGTESREVLWHDGITPIDVFIEKKRLSVTRIIRQGSRNSTMSRFAGRVVKRFGYNDEARDIFLEEADKCDPPLPDEELDTIWHSAAKFAKEVAAQPGYIPPENYNGAIPKGPAGSLMPEDYSDVGQAKALAKEYSDELGFNPATDYLRFDGICWRESKEAALGATVEFTDLQLADAKRLSFKTMNALLNAGTNPDDCKEAAKKKAKGAEESDVSEDQMNLYMDYLSAKNYEAFVMQRRNWKYIKAAMDTCKPFVTIDLRALDSNEFLLNTPSATYDLREGIAGRREHAAEDHITKVTDVDPGDEGAELWRKTLEKTFLGDQELIDYVQQVVGLAAIGKVYQEALIIAYGGGRNGKSTFWNTVSRVLGSYAGRLSADTLTVGCKRNVKPELAETFGKRIIIAAELEEGTRLNTSVVKQLCSTDDIFAEKKYKAPFFFTPSHTVILYTNHLPRVGATDEGTWRRLIVIPFKAVFEKRNDTKNFAAILYEKAAPAVLTWIIEGAKKVIEKNYKIEEPPCVKQAISEYRDQNNWFQQFLTDCCEVHLDDLSIEEKSGELYQEYRNYCNRMGEFARSTGEFYAVLTQAGFARHRNRYGVFVRGLRLKSDFME